MSKKIYLSPSNQTDNRYAYGDTNEAAQCRRIASATEAALVRCGFEVKNGDTGTMAGKVAESNAWGADLHICIHTNAANGKASGTRIFCSGLENEGGKAAKAVFDVLAPMTPGESENIKVRNDLYEITNTKAYCVYIEVDFHDVASVAQWIIEHVTEVGEAIAKGICNHYGVTYVTGEPKKPTATPESGKSGKEIRYHKIADMPRYAQPTITKMVDAGILCGTGTARDENNRPADLDLSLDMIRIFVTNGRTGLYDGILSNQIGFSYT